MKNVILIRKKKNQRQNFHAPTHIQTSCLYFDLQYLIISFCKEGLLGFLAALQCDNFMISVPKQRVLFPTTVLTS